MTIATKAGSFTKSSTACTTSDPPVSQDNAISGLTFQPKVIFLFATGVTNIPEWTNDVRHSMGWTAGTTQNYSIGFGSDDAAATSNTYRRAQNDYCFCLGGSGSNTGPLIRLKSFNSDGASFYYDRNDANAWPIFYYAVGNSSGNDITDVKAGSFTPQTTGSTQTITGVGFQPDIVFFMSAVTNPPTSPGVTSISNQDWFLGVANANADGTIEDQNVMAQSSVDNVGTTDAARWQRNDSCIGYFATGSTAYPIDCEGRLSSTNSDGFVINWVDNPGTATTNGIFYLAIKGGNWNCGSHNSPTAGAPTTSSITGLASQTRGIFMYSIGLAHQSTGVGADVSFSWGAANSSTSRWNIVGGDQDNLGTSETLRGHRDTCLARSFTINSAPTTSTESGDTTTRADLNAFNATSVVFDWEDTDTGTAREFLWVTVGDSLINQVIRTVPTETVNITEAISKGRVKTVPTETVAITENYYKGRARTVTTETVAITEAKSKRQAKSKSETINITEPSPQYVKPKVRKPVMDEIAQIESMYAVLGKTRRAPIDTIQNTDLQRLRRSRTRKPALDQITLTETEAKTIEVVETMITSAHLKLYYSGGVNNQDNTLSLGGAKSTHEILAGTGGTGGFLLNGFLSTGFLTGTGGGGGGAGSNPTEYAWDVVLQSEALAGRTEHRCYYLGNTHGTLPANQVKMWFSDLTVKGEMSIGSGESAANVQEQGPFLNETTPPANVTFTTPLSELDAINLGDIPAGGYKSLWIKRYIPPGTKVSLDESYTLQISFSTTFP